MADPRTAARERLVELLNEFIFSLRKNYGMFAATNVKIVDVDARALTVRIGSSRFADEREALVWSVRNAILMFTQDLLPCPDFVALCRPSGAGLVAAEVTIPFLVRSDLGQALPSNIIACEGNLAPKREQLRERVRALWTEAGLSA